MKKMQVVDPDFKMTYELRNSIESDIVSRAKRQANNGPAAPTVFSLAADHENESQTGMGAMRWALMAVVAALGLGTGFQLGRDQYNIHRANAV